MTYEIAAFANCTIVSEGNGQYVVMSKNNIALFSSANLVRAYEYAEWFSEKAA